jgi:hypothetical protein
MLVVTVPLLRRKSLESVKCDLEGEIGSFSKSSLAGLHDALEEVAKSSSNKASTDNGSSGSTTPKAIDRSDNIPTTSDNTSLDSASKDSSDNNSKQVVTSPDGNKSAVDFVYGLEGIDPSPIADLDGGD